MKLFRNKLLLIVLCCCFREKNNVFGLNIFSYFTIGILVKLITACSCWKQDGRFASFSNLVVLQYIKPVVYPNNMEGGGASSAMRRKNQGKVPVFAPYCLIKQISLLLPKSIFLYQREDKTMNKNRNMAQSAPSPKIQ